MRFKSKVNTYEAFYRAYRKKLFFYLMRVTGDYYLSDDIMQESFARLLHRYGPNMQNSSLLFAIARNAVIDNARKTTRNEDLAESVQDHSIDTEQLLMIRQEYRTVLSAMKQLEKTERDILALAADGDFSYREVAEIVGISEGYVRVKVHRARVKLKEILKQENGP
ncbi:MAG: RNA polymerase sigma factor [Deltaproteobacteria bacterium]|nr:RNA polymerase sigma factor [Deltaproteobacteria bacterium]